MIHGAHAVIFSQKPEEDRAFLRDVIGFPHVDAGGGWLIFGLPPSELAVHGGDENDRHSIYLMCDDINTFRAEMEAKGVETTPVHEEPWGSLTAVTLPGGGSLGVYAPKHPRPPTVDAV